MPLKKSIRKSFRKRGTKVRLAPRTKKAISQIVKKQINSAEETKIYSSGSLVSSALASSNFYTLSPIQILTQGTGNNNRIGNEVFLKSLTIRMVMQNRTLQTLFYRVLVLWSENIYGAGASYTSGGLALGDIFYTGSNVLNLPPNLKLGQNILFDRTYNISTKANNGATPYYQQKAMKAYIPINKKIVYLPGSNYLNKKQLYIVVIPFSMDSAVVQNVTSVGAVDMMFLTAFKDA